MLDPSPLLFLFDLILGFTVFLVAYVFCYYCSLQFYGSIFWASHENWFQSGFFRWSAPKLIAVGFSVIGAVIAVLTARLLAELPIIREIPISNYNFVFWPALLWGTKACLDGFFNKKKRR